MSVPVAIISTVTAILGIVAVPEFGNEVFRLFAGCLVGDLLAEVIALGELFPDDLDDVFCMGIVLCKNERLRHILSAREYVGKELVAECLDDSSDLVRNNHIGIELIRAICQAPHPVAPSGQRVSRGPAYPHKSLHRPSSLPG